MRNLEKAMFAAAIAILPACGGGGGGPSGVDGAKPLTTLTAAEKEMMCDWYVNQVGGYGATDPCPQFGLSAPPNKAECVAGFPSCDVTVGQLEDCMEVIMAAEETCTEAAFAAAVGDPTCQAAGTAGCFD